MRPLHHAPSCHAQGHRHHAHALTRRNARHRPLAQIHRQELRHPWPAPSPAQSLKSEIDRIAKPPPIHMSIIPLWGLCSTGLCDLVLGDSSFLLFGGGFGGVAFDVVE
jgi:hypothetical protein